MTVKKVIWVMTALLGLGAVNAIGAGAMDHAHHHDAADGQTAKPTLNAGKRWATDAPLRQAMGNIHDAINQVLPKVHNDALDAAGYQTLATRIDTEVSYMVAHCRLTPDADAQLHLVIARMLAGAEVMRGKVNGEPPHRGVIEVKQALEQYAAYFDDPALEGMATQGGR